jgi:hypothetical protein
MSGTIQTAIVAVGMLVILYSLYGRIPQQAKGEEDP